MNATTRKMVVWNGLVLVAMIAVLLIDWQHSKQGAISPHWVNYLIVVVLLAFPAGTAVLSFGLQRRKNAAKADGHTLCSKCEYPLDLREGPGVCPECGCKGTVSEHEAASKDWRFWK